MKKIISVVLAVMCVAGLCTFAYAATSLSTSVGVPLNIGGRFNLDGADGVYITPPQSGADVKLSGTTINEQWRIAIDSVSSLEFIANSTGNYTIGYRTVKDVADEASGEESGTPTTVETEVRKGTFTVNVTEAQSPTIANITKTASGSDLDINFTAADFNYTANDGGALDYITITSDPKLGVLILNGSIIEAGQQIKGADLGNLVYSTISGLVSEGTTPKDSFQFTATGTNKLTSNTATVTVTIDRSATVPTVYDTAVSTQKNTTYYFKESDFKSKYEDASALSEIKIMSIPTAKTEGVLKYNKTGSVTTVTVGFTVKAADIKYLYFEPVTGYIGESKFTWSGSNGTNYSKNSANCTISIGSYTLIAGSFSKSVNKTATLTFTKNDFTTNFTGTSASSTLYAIKITSLPSSSYGTLYYGSRTVERNEVILAANLGSLKFTSVSNSGTASFSYQVAEVGATSTYSSTGTVTLSVGYSLSAESFSKSVSSNSTVSFSKSDFESICGVSSNSESLSRVYIASLPSSSYGTLYYNNNTVTVGTTIPVSSLGNLKFTSKSTKGSASFTYKVSDTAAPDTYSSKAATITINIGNTTPTISSITATVNNKNTYSFTKSIFNDVYYDDDNDAIGNIKITSLPSSSAGVLRYDGTAIAVNYELSAANASKLTFAPVSSYTGTATFNWCASDGKEYSKTTTCKITVTNKDVLPTLSNGSVSTLQNTTYSFKQTDFTSLFGQVDSRALSSITVTALPSSSAGTLYLNSKAVSRNQEITRSNLASLSFIPASGYTGTASFTYTATDGVYTTSSAAMSIYVVSSSTTVSTPIISSFKAAQFTASRTVRLTISSYDGVYGTPSQMAFSVNDGAYSSWVTYQTSYDYTLPSAEGIYNIKIKVKNSRGDESAAQSLTVYYDRTPPEPIHAVISNDRKTITVTYNKSIESEYSNLRSYVSLGTSSSTKYTLSSSDTVTVSGATIKITLASTLGTSYNKVYISKDIISDLGGNTVTTEAQVSLQEPTGYSLDGYSKSDGECSVVMKKAKPTSGRLSTAVDSISMGEIASSLGYTGGKLTFEMPAESGTATTRELTLPGDILLSTENRKKIANIELTDGYATVSVSTAWLNSSMSDNAAPFTIKLSSNVSSHAVNLSSVGSSYTVSIESGGFEIPVYDAQTVVLSIPYTSYDSGTAVICQSTGSTGTPMYSSRYADGVLTARIKSGGTYFAAQNILSFTDVPTDHWAYSYIRALSAKTIIDGMGNYLFEPDGKLTRAQFIKVLVTSLDLVDESATCGFADVASTDWHYSYLASAVNAGIITSGASSYFYPDTPITREDMCLFAYRAASPAGFSYPVLKSAIAFTDSAQINSSSSYAVNALTQAGIVNGYPDGSFQPKGTSARSEVSKLIELIMAMQY